MKPYRLEKTAFKKQTLQEAEHNEEYWLSKTPAERLQTAWYLTCSAYGYSLDNVPEMDKTCFTYRRRKD